MHATRENKMTTDINGISITYIQRFSWQEEV